MMAMSDELVLIVDDNEKNVKLARDVLRFAGFRTLEAGTGEGTVAVGRLKAEPRTETIPVVALTSFAMKGDRERFLAAGFDGYLEKPISVKEFPEQVRAFCRGGEAG
jgi:two-component system, cell cycle response regulator DivK